MSTDKITLVPMLDDSFQYDEKLTNDENNSMMISRSYPSLLDLPTEIILHIIKILPQSPYHKCLNVCQRLNEIENGYIVERSTMCICRLHEHSPNLPSHELKLRICMHAGQSQLNTFIRIIKRRPPTCRTKITGEKKIVEEFKNYLKEHDDHPNVKVFLENCETKIIYLSRNDLFSKSIDLIKDERNNLKTEFTTLYLCMILGEDQDLNKRFCNILQRSCFYNVRIDCNSVNFLLFKHCLKNYWHIFDVLDFQKKVYTLVIDHVAFTPIHADLLNSFHNLAELTFKINEVDLDNVKSRILELVHLFKQANIRQLYTLRLFENSSLGYAKDLIPPWANLLAASRSKNLQRFQIISKTDQDSYQNQLTTQFESPNSLSLAHGIARFTRLQFLTINHPGFDSTLIKILPSLPRLRTLDLRINMDMSNKNVIDELCHSLEKCNRLEEIAIYVPIEAATLFGNVFLSLAKIQRFSRMNLYFDSLEKIPADEYFEKLQLIKNLREMYLHIKKENLIERTLFLRQRSN